MKFHNKRTLYFLLLAIIINLLSAGCGALAEDVTPPPGLTSPPEQEISATAQPSPTENAPNEEESPTQSPTEEASVETSEEIEESSGTVSVEVSSPQGEDLPEGLDVFLFGYDHMTPAYEVALPLSASSVTFDDVPFKDGYLYFAELVYEGATYRSAIVAVSAGEPTLNLQIEILGTTTDTSNLVVDRLHIFLDFSRPDVLGVGEIFVVSNMGGQTIVAEENGDPVFFVALPEGAVEVQFMDGQMGERYTPTEDGFADTTKIVPGAGNYEVMVLFDLPYAKKSLEITQEIKYPTGAAIVILGDGLANITSSQLEDQGTQQSESEIIHIYTGQAMNPGDALTFTVSDPNAAPVSRNLLTGLAALGAALIAAGVWFYARSRTDENPGADEPAPDSTDNILDTIIALDDLYQNNEIAMDVYTKRRAELKAQLEKTVGDG